MIVTVVLAIVVDGIGSLWSGFVLMQLWGWFIVPVFKLPALTLASAIGVMILSQFFLKLSLHKSSYECEDWEQFLVYLNDILSVYFVVPMVSLLMGWVVKYFM